MANTPAFEHAVALARDNPGLAIGVHLNLLKEKALLPAAKVHSLVNGNGIFYTLPRFVPRLLSGRIDLREVEAELRIQIEKIVDAGLKVTHLDSHRHFHIYPSILNVVVRLAREYRIDKIRYPRGTSAFPSGIKELLLNTLSWKARGTMSRNGIRHNGRFFDLLKIESRRDFAHAFARFCAGLTPGITELDCHPGFVTGELDGIESTIHNRERQIEILTHPDLPELLRQYNVRLVNYGDIE